MVYVDPKNLGYEPYYDTWARVKQKNYGEIMYETLKWLFSKYIPVIIDWIFDGVAGEEIAEPFEFIVPRTNLNLVQ